MVGVLYLYNIGVLNMVVSEILNIHEDTICQGIIFLREEMSKSRIRRNKILCRQDYVVEIDECCISKAIIKRKGRTRLVE